MKDVFYIRHNSDWGDIEGGSVISHLKKNHLAAIHFDGIESWDSSKYEEKFGPTAIEYLNRLNESDDSIIVASYQNEDTILIGRPKPGSKFFYRDRFEGDSLPFLKCIEIEPIREVRLNEFPQAFLLAPQKGTLVQWHQGRASVNAFLNEIDYNVWDSEIYLPYQLEIVAEEWLRRAKLLKAKLFKTGGYLKDLDTYGIDYENRPVVVQVKFRATDYEFQKFADVCALFPDASCYFFSVNQPDEKYNGKFQHYLLGEILRDFASEETWRRKLVCP